MSHEAKQLLSLTPSVFDPIMVKSANEGRWPADSPQLKDNTRVRPRILATGRSKPAPNAKDYAALLKVAYRAIKDADQKLDAQDIAHARVDRLH